MADELLTNDVQTLEWWTVREVANLFRVDKTTINRLIHAGKIKAARFGKVWRVHESEVQRIRAQGMHIAADTPLPPSPQADEWSAPEYV